MEFTMECAILPNIPLLPQAIFESPASSGINSFPFILNLQIMKKFTALFTLAFLCMALPGMANAFGIRTGRDAPGSKAVFALHHDFPGVGEVTWTELSGQYIAAFNLGHGRVLATYNGSGQLMLTRVFSDASRIPFNLQMRLKKAFPDFEPRHMVECLSTREHCYYFLLKKQKKDLVSWLRVRSDLQGHTTVIQRLHQVVKPAAAGV